MTLAVVLATIWGSNTGAFCGTWIWNLIVALEYGILL